MENIDNAVLDELVDEIFKRVEEKFVKQLNTANVEYAFKGVVTSIDAPEDATPDKITAIVDIGSSTTTYIPNRSGEVIAEGDTVKVFSDKNNMVGAYIGVKL
jgi:hypothetical protein